MTADDGLELVGTSAAVNTGRNTAIPSGITTDITGANRIIGGTVDMGAYEYLNRLYVDSASTGGLNNGTSWANAYTRFDTAVNKAVAGDTIWVAKGTYQPASAASFTMKTGVAIYGGFAGTETALAARNWIINSTILKGNNNTVIINSAITSSAILDGFTVTGGKGVNGGGMSNTSSSPIITNVTFSANISTGIGGGMCNNGSSPTITNVTFSGNTTGMVGGGMYNGGNSSPIITNVTFSGNATTSTGGGGGMFNNTGSSPTITNVTFSGNTTTGASSGGGMYNSGSSPTITNVTFSGNITSGGGGGMFNGNASPIITNAIFSGNTAIDGGGVANTNASPIITNAIFSGNTALDGGGMSNLSSSPIITNATFSRNTTTRDGGGGICNSNATALPATLASITNCVFWGNTATTAGNDIFNDIGAVAIVTYCYTQTTTAGTGNITGIIDPFVNDTNPAGADSIFGTADDGLQLLGCSPTVNTGINTANTISTDITGQPRVFNTTIDMGAYEYQSNPDGTSLAIAGDTTAQTIYPGDEALITTGTCRIIAKVLPDGANPLADTVTSKVYIDPTIQNFLGAPYVQRHFDITPVTNASISTATITLFATQAEFDAYNAVSTVKLPTGPSDVTGIANLNVIQFHGTSVSGTPGTYSGATIVIDPTDANVVWNATLSRWEITFNVTGFSGFIIIAHGGTPLSLNLLSFTGTLVNHNAELQWQTANELNTDHFEIDKSSDGVHFDSLTTVKAIGTGNNNYTTFDAYPQIGDNYYRLKSVNNDGSFTYSNIVLIQVGSNGSTTFVIYPNPTSKQLVVEYNNASDNSIINIVNLTGQSVLSIPTNGQTKTTIDLSNLADGTYMIQYNSDTETLVNKFIKID